MTLHKPTIAVRRFAVSRRGRLAFDAEFHNGVNILRGENSSGKSTIMELLAYGLGSELRYWKKEALLCDYTILEALVNGTPVTLRRAISDSKLNPLDIYWGSLEEAQGAPQAAWEHYPYRGTEQRISFSQALFRAMTMPQVHGERGANITMHQILRLAYADQVTPAAQIFRFEQFDNALTRETIGDLLCGIYDDRLYLVRLELDRLEREHGQLTAQLSSIYNILGRAEQTATAEFLGQEIIARQAERKDLLSKLESVRANKASPSAGSGSREDTKLRLELRDARTAYQVAAEARDRLQTELEDSRSFINAILARLSAVDESIKVQDWLGAMMFRFCPACFNPLATHSEPGSCPLCKSALDSPRDNSAVLRMRNELDLQLRESQGLQQQRSTEFAKLERDLPALKDRVDRTSSHLQSMLRAPVSQVDQEVEDLSRRLGSLDAQIESLYERQKLFSLIKELSDKKAQLNSEMSKLREEAETRRSMQERRRQEAYLAISECTSTLLRRDLDRQPDFRTANNVTIDFAANQVAVDGETQFSASSMVFLNKVFHLALLWAATRHAFFRFPRFLMLDGIEDGGMERDRSHNLQRIISDLSANIEVDHQIIFATAEIDPDLEKSSLVIAHHFTHEQRSLTL